MGQAPTSAWEGLHGGDEAQELSLETDKNWVGLQRAFQATGMAQTKAWR